MTCYALAPATSPPGTRSAGGPRTGRAVALSLAAASVVLLVLLHARNPLDPDEGVVLNGAWNLLNGRRLYFDFFEFLAPGSFYLVLAAWKVFGESFWVAKGVGIVALEAAALGVYRIATLVLGEPRRRDRVWLAVSLLLFCVYSGYSPAINHNSFHLPLAVWSTYCVLRGLYSQTWQHYALGGLLAGGCAWFLQHRAAVMAAATLIALIAVALPAGGPDRRRAPAAYLLGFGIAVGAMLLCWPAGLLFQHLIEFPATRYTEVNAQEPTLLLWSASLVGGAAWLARRSGASAALLLILQACLLLSVLQRADLSHVTSVLFPLVALLPLLLRPASGPAARTFQPWIVGGMLLWTLPLLAFAWVNSSLFLTDWSRHPVLEYVRHRCGESPYVYAGPFAPGLYYETRRLNPTRYSILLPRLHTERQFAEARADLSAHPPPCILTHFGIGRRFGYTADNAVDSWISDNYSVVSEFRGLQVWTRKSATADSGRF